MTDIGITGGGKGSNMLYLSGVQTKKNIDRRNNQQGCWRSKKKSFSNRE